MNQELRSLWKSLGTEQRLTEILSAFYKKMAEDILVGFFFYDKDLEQITKNQTHFMMRAMGAVEIYRGKTPAAAHKDLAPILKGHFDRRKKILMETLLEFGLSEVEIKTWVDFEEQFRPVIEKKEASSS